MSLTPQQWFKFDIPLYQWIRKLSPEAGILLIVIVHKMATWDKTEDTISVSQLMYESGMGRRRVQRAIKDLVESGAPVMKKIGLGRCGSTYAIDLSLRDASVATYRGFTSIATPVSPTTDTRKSINRTETEGGAEAVSVSVDPAPVSLDGSPANRENPAEESDVPVSFPIPSQNQNLLEGEGLVVEDELPSTTPNTSHQFGLWYPGSVYRAVYRRRAGKCFIIKFTCRFLDSGVVQ